MKSEVIWHRFTRTLPADHPDRLLLVSNGNDDFETTLLEADFDETLPFKYKFWAEFPKPPKTSRSKK